MLPDLRRAFNEQYSDQGYARFLRELERRAGVPIDFRVSETPCFFPASLINELAGAGRELVHQLVDSPEYRRASDATIPVQYRVPREGDHPLFVQVDFGFVHDASGRLAPKLVELQAFPSLYGFQPEMADTYRDCWKLPSDLATFCGGITRATYDALMQRALLNGHDPEQVVLMEIDPAHQKTRPDFAVTERRYGVRAIDLGEIRRAGRSLFYRRDGRDVRIARIYNRTILDELQRKQLSLPFDYRDDLEVEWAGHPNWFFRISKFSLPWLDHPSVPRAWFLSDLDRLPGDREELLLKPLYSFAGTGIVFGPTDADIDAIPTADRDKYLIQERVHFEPVISTPHGPTQAEVRMMYVWLDDLTAVLPLIRMGRGRMMGVSQNRDMAWVGASAALMSGPQPS